MRRTALLVAVVAAAVTGAPAVAATSHSVKPQVHDAAGDWKVANQDVLDATWTATAKQLRADLHLSAPPAAPMPALYDIVFVTGCTPYSLHLTWTGSMSSSKATLDRYACSTGNVVTDDVNGAQPVESTPATATITSTGLRIVAAPTAALHRGVRGWAMAEARMGPVVFGLGLDTNNPSYGGDIGSGNGYFRLGS